MTLSSRIRVAVLAALVSLFIGAPLARADQIVNGSFEVAPACGEFLYFNAGSTVFAGWTVVNARVFCAGGYWASSDGVRSIGLASSGGMEQTFPTEEGRSYVVRFDMSGDPSASPAIKHLLVSVAGETEAFSLDMTGRSRPNIPWEERSIVFTAAPGTTTTTITFLSTTSGVYGAAIDNVRVTPFPSEDLPAVDLTLTGCGSESDPCNPGDQFTVQAHWTNAGATSVPTEIKIGFRLPNGTPVNIVGDIHLVFPFPAGVDVTTDLLNFEWPDGRPTGTWTVEATLLGPGLGEVFSRSVEMFEVVP